jgi:6-pyruvoyltetrahydropterin/6-carboxytetrahydropterin synthase
MGIDSFFGASHAMRPSGELHTHSFRVQATLVSAQLDEQGMLYGFREVSDLLEAEAKKYANFILNDIEPFNIIQPTGENLAAVILKDLQTTLRHDLPGSPRLIGVTLWENPTSYVRVTPAPEARP